MKPIALLIAALATYRVTRLVTVDEIARPTREAVSDRMPDSKLEYLVNCPHCVSVWAGAAVQVLPKWAQLALALSGIVSLGTEVGNTLGEAVDRYGKS